MDACDAISLSDAFSVAPGHRKCSTGFPPKNEPGVCAWCSERAVNSSIFGAESIMSSAVSTMPLSLALSNSLIVENTTRSSYELYESRASKIASLDHSCKSACMSAFVPTVPDTRVVPSAIIPIRVVSRIF